jgi:outer membrane lipoprotein-sorting protein
MEENQYQKAVSDRLIHKKEDSVAISTTNNRNGVIVKAGDQSAVYTANEARQLAQAVDEASNQNESGFVDYIRNLADLVDNDIDQEEFDEWRETIDG